MAHTKKVAPKADLEDSAEPAAFAALGLSDRALAAVRRIGFSQPSTIQEKFIPAALTGRDCVGQARTGTGKTAAFLLPIFEHFFSGEKIHALILAPTRELAQQITEECHKLAGKPSPRAVAVYGGTPIKKQIERLRHNPEIIVATPGRVIDHYHRRNIAFNRFSVVVLDEVDRMFDMGFRKDIRMIIGKCTNRRQTLMLSATMPHDIMRLTDQFLDEPIRISTVDESRPSVETLDQRCFCVDERRKLPLLLEVLNRDNPELTLIFTRTKNGAEKLGKELLRRKHNAAYIHGDLPQGHRSRAIQDFRTQRIKILVGTDLMGRGIDIPGVSHVINFDIPQNPEDYLHRVGRSARMNAPGTSITFITPKQGSEMMEIEKHVNCLLEQDTIPGFDNGV